MSPHYQDGDFVLLQSRFFKARLSPDRDIVFKHKKFGLMIKRIREINPVEKTVSVYGTHQDSSWTSEIGPVSFDSILGLKLHKV